MQWTSAAQIPAHVRQAKSQWPIGKGDLGILQERFSNDLVQRESYACKLEQDSPQRRRSCTVRPPNILSSNSSGRCSNAFLPFLRLPSCSVPMSGTPGWTGAEAAEPASIPAAAPCTCSGNVAKC